MKRFHQFLIAAEVLLACLFTATNGLAQTAPDSTGPTLSSADLKTICTNVRQVILAAASTSADSLKTASQDDLKSMAADGSWPDLDYHDTAIEHWRALPHLPRLERIVRVAYRDGKPSAELLERCLTSLSYWLTQDPQNKNWWHNEIGVPREVGFILIMLGDDAPADLKQRGIELMKRANWKRQTGANLLDETWIEVMRGCLQTDPTVIAEAYGRSWQEIRIVDPKEEGIQADGSFHQHGPLLYSESYGDVFLQCAQRLLNAAATTSITPPNSVVDALNLFAFDGDAWMARHWIWDWGTCGRAICRVNATKLSFESKLNTFAELSSPRTSSLQAQVTQFHDSDDAAIPVGNRAFWCSDYTVQRRPDFFASVRMYSTRTANTDTLTTGENKKSHHIADGATCFMLSGQEYFNIYPVWDWLRIPGTTIEQDDSLPTKAIKRIGKTAFVGGVSDGSNGCAVMDLHYNDLKARKAWFCFDHTMVCLGAGINCDSDHAVITTLNQCLMHGEVLSSSNQLPAAAVTAGDHHLKEPKWIWHDHIGYILPEATNVDLKIGPQSGAWADIGIGSADVITNDVFNLAIDHGTHIKDGQYQYIVQLGVDAQQMPILATHSPVQIVSNSQTLQAVLDDEKHQVSAAFYTPGQLRAGPLEISVDQPCLLMVHQVGSSVTIAVSNPDHAALAVNVTVNLLLKGEGATGNKITFDFPSGRDAGKSVVREFALR